MSNRNYPSSRKSPILHTVGQHARQGKKVSEYDRGEGERMERKRKAERNIVTTGGSGKYQVIMKWDDQSTQTENINASDYYNAAVRGMGARGSAEIPIELRVVILR